MNMNFENKCEAAAFYACKLGYAIIPIHFITNEGKCSCGNEDCSSKGKHPIGKLVPNGVKDATKDPEKILEWWSEYPDANIGIATGAVSGVEVLDIDPRNNGFNTLEQIKNSINNFGSNHEVKTGGDGLHLYFSYSGKKVNPKLLLGIDFQSDGKYVLAPPSNHISGKSYVWQSRGDSL